MSHAETNALLNKGVQSSLADKPVAASSTYAIKALSYMRIAAGAACLLAPQFTCALFKYNVPVGSALVVRMVGGRDLALGELLLTAQDNQTADGGRRETRRALWAGLAADAIDVGALAYAVAAGQAPRAMGGLFGGGALVFIGLGTLGLRGL